MIRHAQSSRNNWSLWLRRRTAVTIYATVLLLPSIVWAQQPSPQASPTAVGVDKADGYRLEPVSFSVDKWPTVRFEFNLWNEAEEFFDQLKSSDVKAIFDNRPVEVNEGALQPTARDPAHAIVLIDGSLSMVNNSMGVDKLAAAKDALRTFISKLGPDDTLIVRAFDGGTYDIVARPLKKSDFKDEINRFQPRETADEYGVKYSYNTDLYGAIARALNVAREKKIRNLVILSDGMQDTEESRQELEISQAAFEAYKRRKEKEISELAKANGVRIFTLAIGNKNVAWKHPKNLAYVDADTLKNISNENMGGLYQYIDMPELEARAQTSTASYQQLLEEKLRADMEKVRQSFHYGYALELVLPDFPRDGREHTLEMTFRTGQSSFPGRRYPLFWRQREALPQIGKPVVFATVFIDTPKTMVMPISLSAIYVIGVSGLALLAIIPLILLRVERASWARAQERAVSNSVITVQKLSPYVGKECPNDPSALIQPGDVVVVCPRCGRAHHLSCWVYVKSRCMVRYCAGELVIPEVILERHDIQSVKSLPLSLKARLG